MEVLVLKNLVENSSSNEQGMVLFDYLKNKYLENKPLILQVDSGLSLSSSFLNSSIGLFLEEYGLDNFKKIVKFKGSENQFIRISNYIKKYSNIYAV